MINFERLDHILITIPPGKSEEARLFYANVLQLSEISGNHPKGAIWFVLAGIELHIREEAGGSYSDRHPAFQVTGLKNAKAYLESKNITVSYSSDIDGRQRFFFRDPFGNRFELLEFMK